MLPDLPGVEICRIDGSSLARLAEVEVDVFDAPIDPERARDWLASPDVVLVVAIVGGRVIGQVQGLILRHPDQPTELYIDNLGVTPAWQRRGVATALVDRLGSIARADGCTAGWVLSEPDNAAARGFYAARNFAAHPTVLYERPL
ncbi:GNAT family N-acetyltransferase [Sandarakinorhabdus sp. DWP1-3-1]|uniref:GNAT family N-acetyltransferase n=1 Tax=Sandarakinorhabdus sp. DWP1-3-1 TaxID=2804627 RepID=UPI003CE99137